MSIRLPMVAVLLLMIVAGGASVANAWGTSRLAALAARQDLHDEVCIAMAGGHLSPERRFEILADARKILSPAEFEAFGRALDRVAPPPKKSAVAAHFVRHSAQLAQRQAKSLSLTRRQALQLLAKPSSGPVIPDGVTSPERMASAGVAR
jgi:hypothetical protein